MGVEIERKFLVAGDPGEVGETTVMRQAYLAIDGDRAVKSCSMFAVQADGREILTVEGLAQGGQLHALQQGFWDQHGLQCGFCTPGFLMLAAGVLERSPDISDDDLLDALSSNLCRCTGYLQIAESIEAAAAVLRAEKK